jgi:hypothetical protein
MATLPARLKFWLTMLLTSSYVVAEQFRLDRQSRASWLVFCISFMPLTVISFGVHNYQDACIALPDLTVFGVVPPNADVSITVIADGIHANADVVQSGTTTILPKIRSIMSLASKMLK